MQINTKFDIGQMVYYVLPDMAIRSGIICCVKSEIIRLDDNTTHNTTIYMLNGGGRYFNQSELFETRYSASEWIKSLAITMNKL